MTQKNYVKERTVNLSISQPLQKWKQHSKWLQQTWKTHCDHNSATLLKWNSSDLSHDVFKKKRQSRARLHGTKQRAALFHKQPFKQQQ